jgi:hypothetical protein
VLGSVGLDGFTHELLEPRLGLLALGQSPELANEVEVEVSLRRLDGAVAKRSLRIDDGVVDRQLRLLAEPGPERLVAALLQIL